MLHRLLAPPIVLALWALFPMLVRADGNTIATPDDQWNAGYWTSINLDSLGNPVIAYSSLFDGLRVTHCGDPRCASNNSVAVASSIGGPYVDMALDAVGNPVIAFSESNQSLKVVHCGNTSCTSGNVENMPLPEGVVSFFTSISLDQNGNPIVSYFDVYGYEDLRILYCGDPACGNNNTIVSPDSSPFDGPYSSLALAPSGNPVIAYQSSQLRVLTCGNTLCSSGNTIAMTDPVVAEYISLQIDDAGRPVMSYFDYYAKDLKLLHCGNSLCTSGNTVTTVDSAGDVGQYSSLDLDSIGRPVVSYYDATNHTLKLAHCGNANCTSGNTLVSPPARYETSSFAVGEYTSLVLDSQDIPIVSYHDQYKNQLHVLHCGDPTCTTDQKGVGGNTSLTGVQRAPGNYRWQLVTAVSASCLLALMTSAALSRLLRIR